MAQLRNDAYFWLTNTDGKVRVVIVIYIHADNQSLHLEHREMGEDGMPGKLQELDLSRLANGSISAIPPTATLDVATELLFDVVPEHVTGKTISIPTDGLISFAREYFGITH